MALMSFTKMGSYFSRLEIERTAVALIIMCYKRLRLEKEETMEALAISYQSKLIIKKQNRNI